MTRLEGERIPSNCRGGGAVGGVQLATVNRVARLTVAEDAGLARMHRISDCGAELSSVMDLQLGQRVLLGLSETVSLAANVFSKCGKRYGLAFRQGISSAVLLRELVQEARSARGRPLRLATDGLRAIGHCADGAHQLEVEDISQCGMKVRHGGAFTPGLHVCVQLPNGLECRGIVRWTKGGSAGLLLTDILSADALGAVSALSGRAAAGTTRDCPTYDPAIMEPRLSRA